MANLLDPDLLARIDALQGITYEGSAWRVTWASRDALAGSAGGGRWSPDDRFEALYTSLVPDGALAEAYFHLSRAPIMSSSRMLLNELRVSLQNVLVFDSDTLISLGIEDPLASRLDRQRSQAIGEAAFMLDYQGLIVPSARWNCENLLFVERLDLNENLELVDVADVNWPAWRESAGSAPAAARGRKV